MAELIIESTCIDGKGISTLRLGETLMQGYTYDINLLTGVGSTANVSHTTSVQFQSHLANGGLSPRGCRSMSLFEGVSKHVKAMSDRCVTNHCDYHD